MGRLQPRAYFNRIGSGSDSPGENNTGRLSTHFACSLLLSRFFMSVNTDKTQYHEERHKAFQWDQKNWEALGRKIREKIVRPSVMALCLLSSQLKTFQFITAVRGALVS